MAIPAIKELPVDLVTDRPAQAGAGDWHRMLLAA
jgi:hypothetical protein